MRTTSSLALLLAFASCTAVDNFNKFTVAGSDMGGGCTGGCDCIPADAALGVPSHCRVAPLGGFNCATSMRAGDTVTIAAGAYTLDTGVSPPTLTDGMGTVAMHGTVSGNTALFCVGSLMIASGVKITIAGDRPVAIVADSLIHQTTGAWALGGAYATDQNGGDGVGGGSNGGAGGNAGEGTSGGKAGLGMPGTGGGGGGNLSPGAAGGASVGGPATSGGTMASPVLGGFGGGGGGKGAMFGGGGGGGGGVLQLSASWAVVLDTVGVNATGGGGAGGGPNGGTTGTGGGGGGGGAGGSIALDAPMVSLTGGCLAVLGGPGGAGGALTRGGDAKSADVCPLTGSPGMAGTSAGAGGAPGGNMTSGGNGTAGGGGGGGLGGYGRVLIRAQNPPASPSVNPPMAYVAMTLS